MKSFVFEFYLEHFTLYKVFADSTNKTVFQWGDWLLKYISFGNHQSQTNERIKALYDMYKCMLIISEKKGLETFQKIFRIFVDSF